MIAFSNSIHSNSTWNNLRALNAPSGFIWFRSCFHELYWEMSLDYQMGELYPYSWLSINPLHYAPVWSIHHWCYNFSRSTMRLAPSGLKLLTFWGRFIHRFLGPRGRFRSLESTYPKMTCIFTNFPSYFIRILTKSELLMDYKLDN